MNPWRRIVARRQRKAHERYLAERARQEGLQREDAQGRSSQARPVGLPATRGGRIGISPAISRRVSTEAEKVASRGPVFGNAP